MATQQTILDLKAALELGEGQFIEFKEKPNKSLAREMVAFANASGGMIYLGITDSGKIKGIKTGKIRYDEQICADFDWKDFDDEKFEYYLKLARISNNLSREETLRNLRLLTNEGMTNAGMLYFAKKPYKYIISSKIRCVHFNDDKRVDIMDKKEVDRGLNLIQLVIIKYIDRFLKRNEIEYLCISIKI
jgi:predicted HTH transcriptional regulator